MAQPIQVGRNATANKDAVDAVVGKMAFDVFRGYELALALKVWLDTNYPAGNPEPLQGAFGYSAEEAAIIREAIDDGADQAVMAAGSAALRRVRGFGAP